MEAGNRQKESHPDVEFEYILIPTVEEMRRFCGPVAPKERKWRDKVYFDLLLKSPRSKLGIGEHDRAEAYIFGNAGFPAQDLEAHKSHFPVSVKVMRIRELSLSPGETVDLSAHPDEFPWDTGDAEIYLYLTIERLIFGNRSKLAVNGNVLILNCKEAVADHLDNGYATIELGSSDLIQQRSFSRMHPPGEKNQGTHGINGTDGSALHGESTPFGLRLPKGDLLNHGRNGTDGGSGLKGDNGRNGAMLFLADLRFSSLSGFGARSLHIKARAGNGFPGTAGSDGGCGGHGGKGADGAATPFGIVKGFPGGRGGDGGEGGNGGKGGNGGMACDVFLSVPAGDAALFRTFTFCSAGGTGGKAGKGGIGGNAGACGNLYETILQDEERTGQCGRDGIGGSSGRSREAPKIHIYEHNQMKIKYND